MYKYMEIKQHSLEQTNGQRNQRGNQKVLLNKGKWIHNIPKFGGYFKSSSRTDVDNYKFLK